MAFNMRNTSKILAISFTAILFVLLLLPEVLSLHVMGDLSAVRLAYSVVDSLIWLAIFWAGMKLLPRTFALILLFPVLSGIVLLRFTYLGLLNFSGAGFTSEFFVHFELQSILLAWQEYFFITFTGVVACISFLVVGFYYGRKLIVPPLVVSFFLLFLGVIVFGFRFSYTPEGEFLSALWKWHKPIDFDLSSEELVAWREYPLVNTDLITKRDLVATADGQSPNIILVYLESIGEPLIDHPAWPELMPGLKSLVEKHSFIDNFYASGYITIEGLVNSQCGTLFPFDRGGDSLSGSEGLAEDMVCLGDVLAKAGYQLSYLGGANMSYAGKGDFFQAHGFHNIKGGEHWASMGLYQRPNTWGVSDPDLFEKALDELALLHEAGGPYSLTVLTIGTHLPGYTYEECSDYGDGSERFLNAVHCTDQLLMNWLNQIEQKGYLKDSIVVITADHHIFPSPEMRRLFGEEALNRRRLPLIVIDPQERKSLVSHGASYDLAPTILDILGVEHNSRFSLGRSLLKPESKRDYFFRRYADVLLEVSEEYSHGECNVAAENAAAPGVPLSACQRNTLKDLLVHQIRGLSRVPAKLECHKPALTHARLPIERDESINLIISGKDQSDRFVLSPRRVSPDSLGLYLARIEQNAEIYDRIFIPETALKSMESPPEVSPQNLGWLLIWHGSSDTDLPAWLDLSDAQVRTSNSALWLARIVDGVLEWLPAETGRTNPSDMHKWVMDKSACDYIVNSNRERIVNR